MKVKLLFLALFAIALGACTEEDENFSSDSNEDVVVLKERDPNSPLIHSFRANNESHEADF